MTPELLDFHTEFFQEIQGQADAEGRYAEDSFFDIFCNHLVDAGEIETADRAHYLGARGVRVDGYGGDPAASDGVLSLIVADFNQSPEVSSLTATEMNAIFKRADNFLKKALDPKFRNALEETHPAFGLADLVSARWKTVSRVRLILISNRLLSARVDGRDAGEFQDVPVTYSVWDLERLYQYDVAGRGREELNIDLEDFGGPIEVLPAYLNDAGYEAYLAVVPGSQLAAIYDRWGARLLEQNVRCFLQARSKVNKGLRNTIQNEPDMFFAYNNGITATAEHVVVATSERGLVLRELRNFQIVNGGQTTASIHAGSRNASNDLSGLFVQMKLSIVERSQAQKIVPLISEYANSQNRVNAADFFSNHPFHVRMEEFSRRLFPPSRDGTFRQSKWFYERARGQYRDARGYLSLTERKKFDFEYPKRQMFSKTDLAKFLNLWEGYPDVVSKGAQKNFVHFAEAIGKEWDRDSDAFNEEFYRHAIAKAIVFRHAEKLVSAQPWYEGGYRANVVAYTIAKLAFDLKSRSHALDFDALWHAQVVSTSLDEALAVGAKEVHDVIVEPDAGIRNVTEWAKKQACWHRVQTLAVDWPLDPEDLIAAGEKVRKKKIAKKDQRILNGIQAQVAVIQAGAETWRAILTWGQKGKFLSEKECGILEVAAHMDNGRIPSEKQSSIILATLKRLHDEGCPLGQDIQ